MSDQNDQFAAPDHLSDEAREVWDSVIADASNPAYIAADELAAYCNAVVLERDCARRVREEGTIVADERGRPIAHPAIAVGRQAQQDIKGWGRSSCEGREHRVPLVPCRRAAYVREEPAPR